ncbi:MAG: hypothetical protein HQL75_00340 [Magnetococcales bacterium]|nr:hypothetical protein [Magnetococcales bacterium]
MATYAELEAKRQAIIAKVASLTKSVTHGDKMVVFDLEQATKALALIESEMQFATDQPRRRVRRLRIKSAKGLV